MTVTAFNEGREDTNERSAAKTPRGVPGPAAWAAGAAAGAPAGPGPSFARPLTQRLRGRHRRPNVQGRCLRVALLSPGRGAGPRNRCLRSPAGLGPAARPRPPPAPREGSQLASAPHPTSALSPQSSTSRRWGSSRERAGKGARSSRPGPGRRSPRPGARPATGSPAGGALGETERASAGSRGRRGHRGAAAAGTGKEAAGLGGRGGLGSRAPSGARPFRAAELAVAQPGSGVLPALGRRRRPRRRRGAGCRWRRPEGEWEGAWPPEPAPAGPGHWRRAGGGCGRGDWGPVARHGGAGGRRRSAALGTDLLTHISRRGHGARGPARHPPPEPRPRLRPGARPQPEPQRRRARSRPPFLLPAALLAGPRAGTR